ncbi:hypothetical protein CFP65_6137 [Kitasatospora sp. MMS16-BH015]|uniref:NADPH-dependent FMN reductase n=1 Tax=Kitasatospora sp. MMS16-BH015 TaxID=2018025 RepID=UPI000CA0CCA4|nr:NADPH-dependent FMN reductase [Kitasatospora sp. MMS16-BH015]AUG80804.1 hypothetical protein CFP65_6137 [Kitasatospora sp. MMS16-BH015]
MPAHRLLTVCGSLRGGRSLNRAVTDTLPELCEPGAEVTDYRSIGLLPFFDQDVELAGPPGSVLELRRLVAAADGVVLVSPEYAHGTSGVLKNALEWVVGGGEFTDKPVAVVTASPGPAGGDRAQAWLRETLEMMGARVLPESLPIPFATGKVTGGRLTDPPTRTALAAVLAALGKAAEEQAARLAADSAGWNAE